jgi:hypothetical protein
VVSAGGLKPPGVVYGVCALGSAIHPQIQPCGQRAAPQIFSSDSSEIEMILQCLQKFANCDRRHDKYKYKFNRQSFIGNLSLFSERFSVDKYFYMPNSFESFALPQPVCDTVLPPLNGRNAFHFAMRPHTTNYQ